MNFPTLNLVAILPQTVLVVAALLLLLADVVLRNKRVLGWFSLVAVLVTLAVTIFVRPASPDFQGMSLADGLGLYAAAAILIAAALAILIAIQRTEDFTRHPGPYYALILLASAGMIAMAKGNDFLIIFLGLEIFSLALYILTGFARHDPRSSEASLKYFLLGAFASGFFLYGIALIYGAMGTTNLTQISQDVAPLSVALPFAPLLPIGVGLLLVGYGFKVALVPFHQWTPDVYQGAPTSVTAFMSVATKTAAFASLIRVLSSFITHEQPWLIGLAVIAVLTMTLGNLAALRQTSLKRMLAYSSIAQAGYVLVGIATGTSQGAQASLYYLLVYTFMNLGAFAVVLAVQGRDENDVTMDRMAGLSSRKPGLAVLMAIFMFALTGIPPLAGFFGKLYVFGAAVQAGMIWLAIIAVINSAIAAYYYLRVTVTMFMAEPRPSGADIPKTGWPMWTSIVVAAAATLVLGLWQFPFVDVVRQAVSTLALR
jgi:NADH-quinone oxidoreductase subunit N